MLTPDLIAAFAWLLTIELYALAALPLAYCVFSRLPDRGYAFSKALGLLSVTYAGWLIGLSHTLPNSRWTVLLGLLAVAGLSWLVGRRRFPEMRRYARASAPTLVVVESLLIAVFAGMTLFRAVSPEIVHTEQPMDLMFLNATIASPHYPPADPWMAGVEVSYYYLGYLMTGSVAMLTGIATPVAYNLGLATAAAVAAASAFGVAFNLVGLARGSHDARVLAGLAGAFLLLFASNLAGALELLRTAGGGSERFWEYIGVSRLTSSAASPAWVPEEFWWWFRASRIIPGAITEFPAFSFVLGDLHPHVMSLGFLLLAVGVAMQTHLQPRLLDVGELRRNLPLLLAMVVVVGSLGAINLWDLPVGLALVGGAILLNGAQDRRRVRIGSAVAAAGNVVAVGAPRVRLFTMRDDEWRKQGVLDTAELGPDAEFGASVAAADGVVAVGAPRASRTGVVYLFYPWGASWAHRATLRPPEGAPAREFGSAVAVARGLAAVAATETVYVYREEHGEWLLDTELPLSPEVASADVVVSLDDETLAVGLPAREGGEAHVYERAGGAWERATLTPEDAGRHGLQWFGRSVSVRGARLAVGADEAVAVFHRSASGWEPDEAALPPHAGASFGGAVAIDGQYLVAGVNLHRDRAPGAGGACVFRRTGEGWEMHAELQSQDAGPNSMFGSAAAISGDTVVLGAPGGGGPGSAFLFHRVLDNWTLTMRTTGRSGFTCLAGGLAAFGLGSLAVALPFLMNFESSVNGVLPLQTLMTRPVHLLIVWGFLGFLAAPALLVVLRRICRSESWSLPRFAIAAYVALAPVVFWLQPVYGPPVYGLAALLFAFHQAGLRFAKIDEALFAYNPRFTLIYGSIIVAGGLVWDGVMNGERSPVGGELLAIDRLLLVAPMAAVVALAIYGAWTLGHHGAPAAGQAGGGAARNRWSAHAHALLVLAVASALIMGVELFHVSDVFGGDLRRQNTVFKLYYQAWALLAVVGAFGLWLAGSSWDKRRLAGRLGFVAWGAVVVLGFAAVSYYSLAAVASRAEEPGATTLDGLAYLERTAPADAELIRWVRDETPRDAVVLESAKAPCIANPDGCDDWAPELARVASATGRPTIVGWAGHEWQWGRDIQEIRRRQDDVRTIYGSDDPAEAAALLDRYGVDYVVVGPRERAIYGESGIAKFDRLGEVVFESGSGAGAARVHRVAQEKGG